MANAFDVHRKGSTMLKIGVQLSKLNEAVAFGISFDPCKRLKQLDLNKGLVESSQGMLAPVTGSERFLTVGSSHTVAFCRAVNSGCRTTIPELSLNGSLSLSHILHGKEEGHPFKEMCIEFKIKVKTLQNITKHKNKNKSQKKESESGGEIDLMKLMEEMKERSIGQWVKPSKKEADR